MASNLSFAVGRFLARGWVSERTREMPRFAAIDRAIAGSGLRLVLLLRLSPLVPFNLLNYALAITQVRFRDYAAGSALGMLPGTLLYVYLGSSLQSLAALAAGSTPSGGTAQHALFWIGLVATVLSVVVVTRSARRELDQRLEREPDDDE
ncbi:MAG: VTT domain-containing protein [Polyangiaceae bacterium]